MQKTFSKISETVSKGSGKADLRGWVKRKREMKNKIFILLRDETDEIQCVVDREKADKKTVADADKLFIEASIEISGSLRKDERAPHGLELDVSSLNAIDFGEDFPIQRDLSESFLLDVRHLWLRAGKMRDALKVRATVFSALREFMEQEGAIEVQCPMFVTGAVEGGATMFEVPYFGEKAYLTQSSQFYLETMIFSLGKVYTVAPSFRAEKSRTTRHLTEFWHAEFEAPFWHLDDVIDFEERMLKFIVSSAIEKNSKELKALGRDPKELEPSASKKYERMSYDEVLKIAQKKFPYLKHGSDLGEKEEREITRENSVPLIVTHYPRSLKPFYHRPDEKNPKLVLCNDILAPEGYGEIIGSGERCWTKDELLGRMKEENIDPKPYQWYVDLRKFGAVPHSGFGLGIDRLTSWICKSPHIRDVIPFPRTMNRYYP